MSSVIPRLRWTGGPGLRRGTYYVAVKFNATNGHQYGNWVCIRFPSSVRRAVALLTEQMRTVADIVEAQP